jgi:hypothetical protein
MKMMINVSEDIYRMCLFYKDIPVEPNNANCLPELVYAVGNGTPLPEESKDTP